MPRQGTHFFSGKTIELLRSISMEIQPSPFPPYDPDGVKVIYSLPDGTQILDQSYHDQNAAQSAIWTINHLIEHLSELSKESAEASLAISKAP